MTRRVRVSTYLPGWSGTKAGVTFSGGVAVVEVPPGRDTPQARAVAYFEAAGYKVEDITPVEDFVEGSPAEPARPAVRDSRDAWEAWALHCGASAEEVAASTKDHLIERYGARKEDGQ